MTYTEVTVAAVLVMAFIWWVGLAMKQAELDEVLRWRNQEITDLKMRIEIQDKWTDTLFNEAEMLRIGNEAYIAGMRRDDTWNSQEWIDKTFINQMHLHHYQMTTGDIDMSGLKMKL